MLALFSAKGGRQVAQSKSRLYRPSSSFVVENLLEKLRIVQNGWTKSNSIDIGTAESRSRNRQFRAFDPYLRRGSADELHRRNVVTNHLPIEFIPKAFCSNYFVLSPQRYDFIYKPKQNCALLVQVRQIVNN